MIGTLEVEPGVEGLSVQEVAERTGLSAHTLRYYERVGLLPRVGRDGSSGHRRYTERDLALLEFLKKLRATGMPICQMQEYVTLALAGEGTLGERRAMLIEHRERVQAQITELETSLAVIDWKIDYYRFGMERLGMETRDCIAEAREKRKR